MKIGSMDNIQISYHDSIISILQIIILLGKDPELLGEEKINNWRLISSII